MNNKDIDNKLPIYKLTSKDKVLEYYNEWANKAKFNQDMIDWNYAAPSNTVLLLDQYTNNKNLKILDAGCGSGLAGVELKKGGELDLKVGMSLLGNIKLRKVSYLQIIFSNFKDKAKSIQEF